VVATGTSGGVVGIFGKGFGMGEDRGRQWRTGDDWERLGTTGTTEDDWGTTGNDSGPHWHPAAEGEK